MSNFPPVIDLLPHAPPMVLLDQVVDAGADYAVAAVTIRPDIPFNTPQGVPAHVGLEYMAQTCGIFAGLEALKHDKPVRLGFLLGTRNFQASTPWVASGSRLTIRVTEMFRQELMGVFDCRILCDNVEIASAQLNLYQPEETNE